MKIINRLLMAIILLYCTSCSKLVNIDPPKNTIVSEQAFSTNNNANSAIVGLYSKLINQNVSFSFGNGATTILLGLASDETALYLSDPELFQIYYNQILPDNNNILTPLWQQPYEVIYATNACLEQLQNNNKISSVLRSRLIGEAKFIRAYSYFYLINIFGDVPFLTTTSYKSNSIATRTSKDSIYSHIIIDLESSINDLPSDYSTYNNEKIRCTKWSVMALLSRLYLYTSNWDKAISYSSMLIESNKFKLLPTLNDVFLKNSDEAILQLAIDGTIGSTYNVLPETSLTFPYDRNSDPYFYLPTSFINEFEEGDKRRDFWIDSTVSAGTTLYIPAKYKVGPANTFPNSDPLEYYMVFRLAEQYLIKAEAEANKDDLASAIADLNIIRARAGETPTTFASKDDGIIKILSERKKELFYEWGHRWFDLKRTGMIDNVMSIISPQKGGTWKATDKFFPLPANEVFQNPNLDQNSGY